MLNLVLKISQMLQLLFASKTVAVFASDVIIKKTAPNFFPWAMIAHLGNMYLPIVKDMPAHSCSFTTIKEQRVRCHS